MESFAATYFTSIYKSEFNNINDDEETMLYILYRHFSWTLRTGWKPHHAQDHISRCKSSRLEIVVVIDAWCMKSLQPTIVYTCLEVYPPQKTKLPEYVLELDYINFEGKITT